MLRIELASTPQMSVTGHADSVVLARTAKPCTTLNMEARMFRRSERLPQELTRPQPVVPERRVPFVTWWNLGGMIAGGFAIWRMLHRLHIL
jgi:hypothetical protein